MASALTDVSSDQLLIDFWSTSDQLIVTHNIIVASYVASYGNVG